MHFQIIDPVQGREISAALIREENEVLLIRIRMIQSTESVPAPFSIQFKFPAIDCYSAWSLSLRQAHHLGPNWSKRVTTSRLASGLPLHVLLSATGKNKMTIALSDAHTPLSIGTGICEEDVNIDAEITFFTVPVAPLKDYSAILRLDLRDLPYYDSIRDVVQWWETDCGYVPATVPDSAAMPMNSLWYSYHQQLDVEDILKECVLSKSLGMDTVIIDDGWQTDDTNRGYAYCGDWQVAKKKIPDMKDFIDQIHATGMKAMLWYSVPFIGIYSKKYEEFKDMLLEGTGEPWQCLDPRYAKTREFLIKNYTDALLNWGLDGLKLDFIDSFALRGKSLEYDPRRDYQSLEDAIDRLMTDVSAALLEINPDVMIEFRRSYTGPAIRQYGNILRVGDCPADAIVNRQDIVDLRLISGKTAVHADPIVWNYDDSPESAAIQLFSTLYGVPQISVKIAKLSDSHRKVLQHYLTFWRENRQILVSGRLLAANPETQYSQVCAEADDTAILSVYSNPVVDCTPYAKITAVNLSHSNTLILKGGAGKTFRTINCMGETLEEGLIGAPLTEITAPMCAMLLVA